MDVGKKKRANKRQHGQLGKYVCIQFTNIDIPIIYHLSYVYKVFNRFALVLALRFAERELLVVCPN